MSSFCKCALHRLCQGWLGWCGHKDEVLTCMVGGGGAGPDSAQDSSHLCPVMMGERDSHRALLVQRRKHF
jgi:hypothetical protein